MRNNLSIKCYAGRLGIDPGYSVPSKTVFSMNPTHDITDPRNQHLIAKHTPLVEKIAYKLASALPANIECDDLIQDGLMGLIDAIIRTSRATSGAQFESYIALRARGAMLDGLRANDPANRQIRRTMRQVEITIQRLGHEQGRAPYEGEVAAAMGMTIGDYQRVLQDAQGYLLISLEDLDIGDGVNGQLDPSAMSNSDPFVVLERRAFRQALATSIIALPKQSQTMLRLYYEDDLKMRDIGHRLGLSESRVSQIHAHAIAQLRATVLGGEYSESPLKPRRKPRSSRTE
jgi:RNA polymerase sigma factor for flagellar operon FliA